MMVDRLKKNKAINTALRGMMAKVTRLSPELASRLYYFNEFHQFLHLRHPVSFEEKLMALKLGEYNHNPLITQCCDKYKVREYVTEKGCGDTLNELYGVWDNVQDIQWELLPNKFVVKCNHGCGYNIFCTDKRKFDKQEAINKLKIWMAEDFWVKKAEVNYRYIKRRIICEAYIDDSTGELPTDYKFYCFHGKPMVILVINERSSDKKESFLSLDWIYLGTPLGSNPIEILPSRPISLERMVEASKVLSEPFPFVRVDFYQGKGKPVFGELTFTPGECLYIGDIDLNGKKMAEYIQLKG